ncbi:MAG: hypothetical protein GX575_09235 [Candidatus Anammoximicrobium sp.]|nr:hypothetical protein [Candidatus Anammoximicrobium sp.]
MSKGNLAVVFVLESIFWPVSHCAAQEAERRTRTDRSGGHQVRAQLVEFKDGQVKLKKEDGGTVSLPVDNLSDADRVLLCGPDASKTPPGASGPQVKVVATGVGMDGEMALKNAFSHAIEQAVGVLVDAETIVDNDQLSLTNAAAGAAREMRESRNLQPADDKTTRPGIAPDRNMAGIKQPGKEVRKGPTGRISLDDL